MVPEASTSMRAPMRRGVEPCVPVIKQRAASSGPLRTSISLSYRSIVTRIHRR